MPSSRGHVYFTSCLSNAMLHHSFFTNLFNFSISSLKNASKFQLQIASFLVFSIMGGCIFLLKYSTFLRMSLIKPLSPCLSNPIKRYSLASKGHHHHHNKHEMKERAPSTAEEFKRMAEQMAEQKLREAEQGVASQVLDKVYDATEEATLSEAKLETVKKRCIEHEPGADYRSRGDNDQDHDDHQ